MIQCSSCGHPNPPGTNFCEDCGAKLSAPVPAGVAPTAAQPLFAQPGVMPAPAPMNVGGGTICASCGHPNPAGSTFCENCGNSLNSPVANPNGFGAAGVPNQSGPRFIAASGAVIVFKPGMSWLIGREDPVSGISPDIDLTPYDTEQTASRKHAQITINGSQVTLTSLTTTNWTRLNGQRLTPNQPMALNPGDKLEFAKVQVTFAM